MAQELHPKIEVRDLHLMWVKGDLREVKTQ